MTFYMLEGFCFLNPEACTLGDSVSHDWVSGGVRKGGGGGGGGGGTSHKNMYMHFVCPRFSALSD